MIVSTNRYDTRYSRQERPGHRRQLGHRPGDRHPLRHWGTSKLGIETVPPIVTRSVLADIARYRGLDRLQAGSSISAADLGGAQRAEGVVVEPGDVLLFHTGWGALWDEDPARYTAGEPGIGMAVAEWLVEHRADCRLQIAD